MGTCKLMKRLMDIEGVVDLSYKSIEQIKSIICGTHNGVCSERFSGIKDEISSGLLLNRKTIMIKYLLESIDKKGWYIQSYSIDDIPVIGDNPLNARKFDSEESAKYYLNENFKIIKFEFNYKRL